MNNPNFKETNKILIEDYKEVSDILVYKLKNISNAFYIACSIRRKDIQIQKYCYETKSFKNIGKIDVDVLISKAMKYLYNPLDKKEYFFFINDNDQIEIYLIKNENTFQLIQKLKYINDEDINIINNNNNNNNNNENIIDLDLDLNDSFGVNGGAMFTSFNFLDVIYNEMDKNVYVIIIYFLMQNAGGDDSSLDFYRSKSINIFKFKGGKLNLIKTFKFDTDFNMNSLIYINKDCGKKYLIDAYQKDNLILIELKSNYNNYQIENFFNDDNNKNKLSNFIRTECFYGSCITYAKNKFDFLYILQGNKLMVINFTVKNIEKIVDFNQTYFLSIHNWNNNYLIFFQYGILYIYDIDNNKIITRHKKVNCRFYQSHFFQGNGKDLAIFMYYDKIECYFV